MAHAFTRVTLIGSRRHLDLLLPSHQPVGLLLPQVLELLDDQPAEEVAAKVLVRPGGDELDAAASLHEAAVTDGSSLLLCNASSAPPPPVVYDVTDLAVSESQEVPGRWSRRSRDLTAGLAAAAGIWGGAELFFGALVPGAAWWALLVLSVALLVAGTALGQPPRRSALGPALLGAGWLTGLGGILRLDISLPQTGLTLSALSIAALLAVGFTSQRPRALYNAAAVLAAATVLWSAAALTVRSEVPAAAVATLAGVVLLGLLPKFSLAASGLATLDDQRAKGGPVSRTDAMAAIAAAHHSLALGTAISAVSIGVGLWLLGTDTENQAWTLPLLLVLTLAVFLRARSFPLVAERASLYAASAVGVAALALASLRFLDRYLWAVGLAVLAIGLITALTLAISLPDHAQARFRLLARRLETLAVLATVPLAVGMFGVFDQLLGSFR